MILLRYFSREVLYNTLAVALVLLLVFTSQRFVRYLGAAAAGDIDPAVLIPLIIYRIPGILELVLPLSLFVALLLVYGRMYLDNEMRVLFAAGVSRYYLLFLTFVPVLILATLVACISLYASPYASARVQIMLQDQEDRSELDSLSEGKFHPFRNGSGVIYVEKMTDPTSHPGPVGQESSMGKEMEKVYIFQNAGSKQGEVIVVADRGRQINNENGRYLLLENGYRLRLLADDQGFERIDYARYGQHIEVQPSLEYRNLKVDALPLKALMGSDNPVYQAAWQWRISLVVLVLVVALLAVSFGKADARQGRYFKVLPAILIYLVYLVLLNMVRDRLASGVQWAMNPFVLVHVAFGVLAVILLSWEDLRRRFFL